MKIKGFILILLSLIFFACENPASEVLDNPAEDDSDSGLLVNDYLELLELDAFSTPGPLTAPSSSTSSSGVTQTITVMNDEWDLEVQDHVWESVYYFEWPESHISMQMIRLAAETVNIYEGIETVLGTMTLPAGTTGPNGESQMDFGTLRVDIVDESHIEVFHVFSILIKNILQIKYYFKYEIVLSGEDLALIEIYLDIQCDQEETLINPTPIAYTHISVPHKTLFIESLLGDKGLTYAKFDSSGIVSFLKEVYDDDTDELEGYTGAVSDSQCAGLFEYSTDRIVFEYYDEQSFLLKSEGFTQEIGSSDTVFNGNNYLVQYMYPLSSLSLVNASATLCNSESDPGDGLVSLWWLDLNGNSQFDSETETDLTSLIDYQELEVWNDNLNVMEEDVIVPVYCNSNDVSGVYFNYTAGHESTISDRRTELETLIVNRDTLLTHPKGSTPEFPAISEFPDY